MDTRGKIIGLTELKKHLSRERREKKEVAFTNGCFDLLHYGHVRYLEAAKKRDRVLVVGLNSDRSVRKLKGPQRPIQKERARAALLAALACVDYVFIFDEDTPLKAICRIKPDILIKGADWKGKWIVGQQEVVAWGGRVELIRFQPGCSTSGIVKAILGRG